MNATVGSTGVARARMTAFQPPQTAGATSSFTSSARTRSQTNRAYSRFAAHALLEHGGDFRAAARELARRYGFSSSPKETREEENPPGAEKRYGAGGGPYFYIRTADPKRVRAPRPLFAHQGISGYIYLGNVAGQTGPGDVGKTTLTLGFIAPRLSRGQLPGIHFEDPVDILIVGDEDDIDEVLTPAFIAGGGDTSRLHFLVYGDEPLVLRRDIKTLRDAAGDYQAKLVYLVQILDHMERDSSYVSMQDVRALLQPFRLLARELDFAGMFAMHPPKGRQTGMARELGGGSGQFTDVPRSGLIVGYHPTEQGRRAFGRGKGNIGRVPPTVSFIIEGGHAVNPATSEVVEVGRIADLREEPNLPAEDLSMRPVKEPEELKKDVIERVMRELGADGDWHTREYAKRACTEAGVGESTFNDRYPRLDFIERRRNGREWRLRDE
jgi:hypothetical protein